METLLVNYPELDRTPAAGNRFSYGALAGTENLGKVNIAGSCPVVAADAAYSMLMDRMYINGSFGLPCDMGIAEVLKNAAVPGTSQHLWYLLKITTEFENT